MRVLLKPLQWIYCVYALVLFVGIMLLIFPFVIIASLLGRIKGGNMILRLCMIWGDIWFPLVLIFPKRIYKAPHDKRKSYIFVTNHISYLDAAFIVMAYRQHIRPLGKVEMSRIPIFGFIYNRAIVGVDRSSTMSRANSIRLLKSILMKGISILVFPEGTFNKTHKPLKHFYDGAFRVSIETGTPIKPVLFLDTYDRMHYDNLFSLTPGKCRCVYLDEIPVNGLTLHDVHSLKEKVYKVMETALTEYHVSWIKKT